MHILDTDQWLRTLPVDKPVTIDGVEVWLKLSGGGAELGAYLMRGCTETQLQNALQYGLQAAIEFDAGFGLSEDGSSLCLSQWLPDVGGWVEAAEPLEKLLNQVDMLRGSIDPARSMLERDPVQERIEQRMRDKLEGRVK